VNIIECLTDCETKCLKKCNKILTFIWCLFVTINMSSLISYVIISDHYFKPLLITFILAWCIYWYGFIIAIPLLLIHTCYAVYLMEKRLLVKNANHINYEVLRQKLLTIERHKESINECLGIFPFLWFCEMFSTTCLRLTYFVINNNDKQINLHILKGFTEYICISVTNIAYVLTINYFQTHRPTANQLQICYEKYFDFKFSKNISLNSLFIQYFVNYSQSKYMAFNVFAIDIKFLFVFIGSVITFTVMLIQLLNN